MRVKAAPSASRASAPKKRQPAGIEGGLQLLQEQPTEQARQHPHRQKEAGSTGDPTPAVRRQAAAGDETMDVRMVLQVLAPGVEHGDETDLGAEMPWIGGDRAQRLGRGPEQDGVDRCLVLERDFGDRGRQCEDDVEIGHRQQLGLALGQPLRRGPHPGISGNAGCGRNCRRCGRGRIPAALDMAAERRRPACLDGAHDAALDRGRGGRHAPCDRHRRGGGRCPPPPVRGMTAAIRPAGFLQLQPVERAGRIADRRGRRPAYSGLSSTGRDGRAAPG